MNNLTVNKEQRFYGRRKGRKLSESSQIALKQGENFYIIKLEDFFKNKHNSTSQRLFGIDHKKIILEIGFGSGDNLVNSAINNPNICYIGADPFLNTNARLIKILLKNNVENIKIWPDDIRKIIPLFPYSSVSEIKILFPDPWPKSKHKNRRLVQELFFH